MKISEKRLVPTIVALALLHLGVAANAAVSTVTFKGGDIVGYTSSTLEMGLTPPSTPYATPTIGDGRVDFSGSPSIGTYSRPGTNVSSLAFNAWLGSFAPNEGISQFNLWLQDGASNQAGLWGETIALSDAYSTAINPFASDGWTASVYTIGNEWGAPWLGRKLITYTANSMSNYLRPGSAAEFGFTADIVGNAGATGPDYQMWVGAGNEGSDTGTYQIKSSDGANYFQRAITAHVSESSSVFALVLTGMGALLVFKRRLA